MKFEQYIKDLPSLKNKKVIITGANSGVGFECAKHCLSLGARLVMACRDLNRANQKKEELELLYPETNISIIIYEQSSLESMRNLAREIISNHSDFYAINLNAGIYHPSNNEKSIDGFDLTIATNFLSIYVFLEELSSYLKETKDEKRIIFQGSLASRLSSRKIPLNGKYKSKFHAYCISKFALENLFFHLSQNNTNKNVKYLLTEPGITNTNIIRGFPKIFQFVGKLFLKTFMMSSEKASLTSVYAIAGNVKSGDAYLPKGFYRIRGYPKLFKIKRKYISNRYNKEAIEVLNDK